MSRHPACAVSSRDIWSETFHMRKRRIHGVEEWRGKKGWNPLWERWNTTLSYTIRKCSALPGVFPHPVEVFCRSILKNENRCLALYQEFMHFFLLFIKPPSSNYTYFLIYLYWISQIEELFNSGMYLTFLSNYKDLLFTEDLERGSSKNSLVNPSDQKCFGSYISVNELQLLT